MKKHTIFLFQGDSITDGMRGRNGDPNHCMGHGYAFSVASFLAEKHAEQQPSFLNRGVGGDTSAMVLARWENDALALHPGVLSLLVGVNDQLCHFADGQSAETREATSPAAYEHNLRTMLSRSRAQNPELKILLGIPFFYRIDGYNPDVHWNTDDTEKAFTMNFRQISQFRAEQKEAELPERQEIARKIGKEFGAVMLDFPAAFADALHKAPLEYWTWDGIHPTYAGHQLLTRVWLDAWAGLDR